MQITLSDEGETGRRRNRMKAKPGAAESVSGKRRTVLGFSCIVHESSWPCSCTRWQATATRDKSYQAGDLGEDGSFAELTGECAKGHDRAWASDLFVTPMGRQWV
jgi:hypothetical protein